MRHWGVLMLADRVDVLENRLGPLLAEPLRNVGLDSAAATVERHPAAVVLGAVSAVVVVKSIL